MVNPDSDPRYDQLWSHYHSLMERKGVSVDYAKREVRRRATLLGALLLKFGYGDGMICGTYGMHGLHLKFIETVLGRQKGVRNFYTMNLLSLPGRTVFLCDTYVNYDPTPEQVVEMTRLAADEVRRFGISRALPCCPTPVSAPTVRPPPRRCARLVMLHSEHQDLDVEGEMHGDAALDADIRKQIFPNAKMKEDANLLIFPTLDAANIAFNLLKTAAGEGMTIGPSCSVRQSRCISSRLRPPCAGSST
jgi:malate dehydrogenase (oxaloacetate-decarboxylating)(NADP+)